jgi:hypothetical protein
VNDALDALEYLEARAEIEAITAEAAKKTAGK